MTAMHSERVSIIIPCYNAARWLRQSVRSALEQTWPDKEVIIINDGSTDDSLALARSLASTTVRVLDQPNAGAAAARNAGLRLATGRYIQFLDADDLLAPDKIRSQISALAQAGDAVLASGPWGRFVAQPEQALFTPRDNWRSLTGVEFLESHWHDGGMMPPAAWLAPRRLLDCVGPWDETLSLNDDGEYFARVMLASSGIVFCPEARSYYRSNIAGSLSGRKDAKALDSLYRSTVSITRHLLAAEASPRTRAAAGRAWMLTAFEVYPVRADLARAAERQARAFGARPERLPGGGRFQLASKALGWKLAKRLFA